MEILYDKPVYLCSGGYILYVEICNEISIECNKKVHTLYYQLLDRKKEFECIEEMIPAYSGITIFYDPRKCGCDKLRDVIEKIWL